MQNKQNGSVILALVVAVALGSFGLSWVNQALTLKSSRSLTLKKEAVTETVEVTPVATPYAFSALAQSEVALEPLALALSIQPSKDPLPEPPDSTRSPPSPSATQ